MDNKQETFISKVIDYCPSFAGVLSFFLVILFSYFAVVYPPTVI